MDFRMLCVVRGCVRPSPVDWQKEDAYVGLRPAQDPYRATGYLLFQIPSTSLRPGGTTQECEKAFHAGPGSAGPLSRDGSVCVALREATPAHPRAVRWEEAPTWYSPSLQA